MNRKVYIGMSGGVDSSVAAYLLREQGYDVTGFTMQLCDKFNSNDNITAAQAVADKLGIVFKTIDMQYEFAKTVIEPFITSYENGETPNPCVECNRCIKFDISKLTDQAEPTSLIATGHYAVTENKDGRYCLRKSDNIAKDQSYFLYTLSQDTLSRVIFPLGNMNKYDVREIAESQCLVTAHKKDSQDICFIPDGDHAAFIKNYSDTDYPEGNFVDTNGQILGRHKGLIKYTIGQRKGLGLALKKPMYVCKLDVERNEVVLDDNEALFTRELIAHDFNWVSIAEPETTFRALGRIRYRHKEAPCEVTPLQDGRVSVVFDEPQRAITSGQSIVLYDVETDSYVLGGGKIE